MDLSDMGEFGFLEKVRSWLPPGSARVGIGDDAAVVDLAPGAFLVATTDALIEGAHFRWDWSSPSDVGWKAVSVNVSDLAAMGAVPRWLLVTLGAPPDTGTQLLEGLYEGIGEACAAYGTEVIGGDTVRADTITIGVTALGELEGDPLTRAGAKIGDVLAATGPLGRAAAGVNLLLSQDPKKVTPEDAIACMDAHRRPRARVEAGLALGKAGVHAVIDISDGLASDVRRMAESSGVGAEITDVPIAPEAARIAYARGWDAEKIALSGGEDFELLVALPAGLEVSGLIEVGRVVEEGVWRVSDGERTELPVGGWDHFR